MKPLRNIIVIITTIIMALHLSSYPTHAQTNNTILFGDSIFANPTYKQLNDRFGKLNPYTGQGAPGRPSPQGCPQGAHTVATELQRITGKRTINYGCPGTSAASSSTRHSFQSQVNTAIANGDVSRASNIIIMMGINDAVKSWNNPTAMINPIAYEIGRKIQDIKRVNPHVNITTVSYPAFSADNGAVCPVRINPLNNNTGVPLDTFAFRSIELSADQALYRAARNTGSRFYDLNAATKYNNMCAPNNIRWVAGTIDTQKPHNFAGHLTHSGVTGVAGVLARNVIR